VSKTKVFFLTIENQKPIVAEIPAETIYQLLKYSSYIEHFR